jgi:hypothetical protein
MRTGTICAAAFAVGVLGCSNSTPNPTAPLVYEFGPYTLQPFEEITNECVQITLDNAADLYINTVELTTGPGFHHSNWFWLPTNDIQGSDGTFVCADRNFDEAAAAVFGGVVFAQSTQAPDSLQAFPPGAAIRIPAHSKLVAQIHLLNPGESAIKLSPKLTLTPLAKADVTTQLAAISFEDMALGLPPDAQSSFTLDCDLGSASVAATGAPPSFNLYYVLAHYHKLGIGMTVEAVTEAGSATTVFETTSSIGNNLGGTIDPIFDFTGYSRIRFTCDFYNSTAAVVPWGTGSNEMCVMLAFSDSPYEWGGGVVAPDSPGPGSAVGNVMTYSHPCTVYATPLAQ